MSDSEDDLQQLRDSIAGWETDLARTKARKEWDKANSIARRIENTLDLIAETERRKAIAYLTEKQRHIIKGR
ncbi:hypothetical protein [Hoyosella altamirensis]|uniref:hypothetical protein n=1 Tax=Hoyosella altamirensis TaxID=616997 RepID=UPI0007DB5C98|nr:hypothetical protein [Hoyosella altamirensis]